MSTFAERAIDRIYTHVMRENTRSHKRLRQNPEDSAERERAASTADACDLVRAALAIVQQRASR